MQKFYLFFFFFFLLSASVFAQKKEPVPEVRVYPNPTTSYFSVRIPDKKIAKVEIYSLIGIRERVITKDYHRIDIRDLPKGIYMIKVYTAKTYVVKKLVKRSGV